MGPTFAAFKAVASKTQVLPLTQHFAMQLLVLSAVTPLIAETIIGTYATSHALREAYRRCTDDGERRKLLVGLEFARQGNADSQAGTGKIGLAVSTRVFEAFYA